MARHVSAQLHQCNLEGDAFLKQGCALETKASPMASRKPKHKKPTRGSQLEPTLRAKMATIVLSSCFADGIVIF